MFLNNILGKMGAIKELRGFKATFFVDIFTAYCLKEGFRMERTLDFDSLD